MLLAFDLPDLFHFDKYITSSFTFYLTVFIENTMKRPLHFLLANVFACFAYLFSSSATQAQTKVHLGLTTAGNASFVLDQGLSADPRYNSTMTYKFSPVGFVLGLDLTPTFGLSLESILSRQGQIYEIIGQVNNVATAVGERRISLEYLQLPLLMNFMGGGSSRTRANFMLGPQFSLLTKGLETYQQTQKATFTLPQEAELPSYADPGSYNAQTRTYTVSSTQEQVLANSESNNPIQQFKKSQFGVAGAFGLNIDLSNFLFLTTQIRANYTITDMRNEDFINLAQQGNTSDIFGRRGNLLVGVQLGLHYMFGGTRSNTRMLVK